jgi:hypothetical protein
MTNRQSFDAASCNDDMYTSSCPVSPNQVGPVDVIWQFSKPTRVEQPEDAPCEIVMTSSATSDLDESRDIEDGPESLRERRDSGVGFSLTRPQRSVLRDPDRDLCEHLS